MSLLGSAEGLISTVKDKVSQVSTAFKIIACLPSILTAIPATLGAIGASVAGSVAGLISGLSGVLMGVVDQVIGQITGAITSLINQVLNLQAQILSVINQVKGLFDYLKKEVQDVKDWLENEENCKFAAAELVNCIAGKLLGDLTSQISNRLGGGLDLNIDDYLENFTEKLALPGEQIDKWVGKTAGQIDKATAQIGAANLF